MPKTIDKFDGEYRFLSNFYASPIKAHGKMWPTAEHLFQAAKSNDPIEREAIRLLETPGQAKRMGRRLTLREDWDQIKNLVMFTILELKFDQNPELAARLVITGDAELIEGNTWNDTYWGVCNGKGHNYLGRMLMRHRSNYIHANDIIEFLNSILEA